MNAPPTSPTNTPASHLRLPTATVHSSTVYQYLCQRFAHISPATWADRMARGRVHWDDGAPITPETCYQAGRRLTYYREVHNEAPIPFEQQILYQDAHLLVACKPHFLPSTPGGKYVEQCLLARLQKQTGHVQLSLLHRLDMDTAGLVLCSMNPQTRAHYHHLFSARQIQKCYLAVAQRQTPHTAKHWRVENRIIRGTPSIISTLSCGPSNAVSRIHLLAEKRVNGHTLGLFSLYPETGKMHQLRLHMSTIGHPILHDRFYPQLTDQTVPNYDLPLQLLAKSLRFTDPITGLRRHFVSGRRLACW